MAKSEKNMASWHLTLPTSCELFKHEILKT